MKSDDSTGIKRGLTNYGDPEFSVYIRKAFAKAMGYAEHELERPIIGIIDTSSGFNSWSSQLSRLNRSCEKGRSIPRWTPDGIPDNITRRDVYSTDNHDVPKLDGNGHEEMIRAQPMDGVVLLGGCDKTVPAQLMGAV